MELNLSGNLGGQIDEMLAGSVAGNINLTGGTGTLVELSITENGTYEPSGNVDGYNKVIADIQPTLQSLNVTENGTYTPPSDVDGYDEISVNVQPTLNTLTITENGTYTPPSGVDGYDEIIVNVQGYNIVFSDDFYVDISGNNWINTNIKLYSNYNFSFDFRMTGEWRQDGAILGNSDSGNLIQWTPYSGYWYYSPSTSEARDGEIGSNYIGDHNITYSDSVIFDNSIISSYSRPNFTSVNVYLGYRSGANTCQNTLLKRFQVTDNNTSNLLYDFRPFKITNGVDTFLEGIYDTVNEAIVKLAPVTTIE